MVICVTIFSKWDSPRVLFLQAAMGPFTLMGSQLIKIYVQGQEATGDLKRPWAPPPGMFDELQKAHHTPTSPATTTTLLTRGNTVCPYFCAVLANPCLSHACAACGCVDSRCRSKQTRTGTARR